MGDETYYAEERMSSAGEWRWAVVSRGGFFCWMFDRRSAQICADELNELLADLEAERTRHAN
jgi:hypothetical protein